MKEITKKDTADKKINLRDLDDTECTNVVCGRQIKRMIRKFPSMADMSIDCWIHGGHYTRFKFKDGKFIWEVENNAPCIKGCESVTSDSGVLNKYELNKLIVFTFSAMCASMNGANIEDTPEDLLALAESKLQELLSSESQDSEM